jgi:sulfate-transporting ATPase
VAIGTDSLVILAGTTALTLALWVVYRWTRFGVATSALAEGPRSLAGLGWNPDRLRAANWAVGGALAGLAGAALGPLLQLTPGTFTDLLVPTLAAAMIGELRSFPATLLGGLLVGVAQAVAGRYVEWTGVSSAVPFALIILVLVVRGRSLPLRSFVHERLPSVGKGEVRLVRVVVALALVAVVAAVVDDDWVIGATFTLMTAIVLLSQVVVTGYAGQLSLAQLTLAGVGALGAANVAARFGAPFLVSLCVGVLTVIPVSLVVGMPSMRARGVSLAIATLGLAVALNDAVLSNSALTGGLSGLTLPAQTLFGWDINATLYPRRYFMVVLAVFALLGIATANVRRGRVGRRLLAVRNNERGAEAVGIHVAGTKLYAFVLAGSIAGVGGVLLVFNKVLPQFSGFGPLAGLANLMGVVIGGIGYVPGALLGGMFNNNGLPNAILYPYVGQLTWWTEFFPLAVGVLLVFQLVVDPNGIAARGAPAAERVRELVRRTVGRAPGVRALRRRGQVLSDRRQRTHEQALDLMADIRPASRGAALHARGMRVVFGSTVALDGVDLDVEPGQVVAVIGPNGAGKTTLLDALTGFVSAEGSIELAGRPIQRLSPHRRSRLGLSRSFQSLELFEDMTVLDNLRCAADPQDRMSLLLDLVHPGRGGPTPATVAVVRAFGLRPHLSALPTEIGYGQRRLVAIARAVAGAPSIILLDEPAAGLSEFERAELARMITLMAREWNLAVLVIEHDVNLVRQVSDHVVALDFGRVIASGTADEVLAHHEVVRAYLGTDDHAAVV